MSLTSCFSLFPEPDSPPAMKVVSITMKVASRSLHTSLSRPSLRRLLRQAAQQRPLARSVSVSVWVWAAKAETAAKAVLVALAGKAELVAAQQAAPPSRRLAP